MLFDLLDKVWADTLSVSLPAFKPELVLTATIVVLLLLKMLWPQRGIHAAWVTLAGVALALCFVRPWQLGASPLPGAAQTFTGMLFSDSLAIYLRALVLCFVGLLAVFTMLSGIPSRADATDFFVLILGATIGMCLMISTNHMLILFLGVEMASVPSYALAGFLRNKRESSEAALKFAIYGAATAGIMLYGISLVVGVLGSAHLPTMAGQLPALLAPDAAVGPKVVLSLGGLMIMVGIAFKLSAVPFHFWAPDVFEGAAAEVAAFLSVASKIAALGLLVRLALSLSTGPAAGFIGGLIGFLAAITCTFGNLAAYGQNNMKRLLSYSTIAHAGYMMMPVAAAAMLAPRAPQLARDAVAALGFYAAVYLFMNLAAFAFVAFVRNQTGREDIPSYAGLIRRSPGLALCMSIVLFSLVGLPPLAGFMGKFAMFSALANFDPRLLTLLVVGGLNTVLSLFYYLRVVRVMTVVEEPEYQPAPTIALASPAGLFLLAVTVPVVVLGLFWNGLFGWAAAAAAQLLASA